jgi:hypothetical protein
LDLTMDDYDLGYGITVDCPAEAKATEAIPVHVVMRGNERTYWDNDGIIDKALTVALLRRDRPGLSFLAKIDPRAIMLPDQPLPGRPSDQELDASTVMVVEKRTLDAAAPEQWGRGAAEYFVTGAFSQWWSGVRELRVTDPAKRVAPPAVPRLGPDGRPWKVRPRMTNEDSPIRLERAGDEACLVIPIRAGLFAGPEWASRGTDVPWVSVVGFNLRSRGGGCGESFAIDAGGSEVGGEVSIPIRALSLMPIEGEWLFMGVAGGDLLPPAEVQVRSEHET